MDPENLRTIVNGVVTGVVGVVPSTFLYFQNKLSAEREAKERAEQRASDDSHRSASERAAHAEAKERKYEADRQRYLRYSRAVEGISASIRLRPSETFYNLPGDLRTEAAAAYEDVMLSVDEGVRNAASGLRAELDTLIVSRSGRSGMPTQNELNGVDDCLDYYRECCRASLRLSPDDVSS